MMTKRRVFKFRLILLLALLAFTSRLSTAQVQIPDFITLTETVEAPIGSDLQFLAETQAVASCIGRLFFSDKLLITDDILDKYVALNYKNFISEAYPGPEKQMAEIAKQEWRIVVRFAHLRADLEHMQFLYEPRYDPFFTVIFQRRDDGQPTFNDEARQQIIRTLQENNVRIYTIDDPGKSARGLEELIPLQTDFSELSDEQKLKVRVVQMKNGIELLVTGHLNVIDKGSQSIYLHEDFFYNDVELILHLYRVDNGELLYSGRDYIKSTARDLEKSIQASIQSITENMAEEFAKYFKSTWRYKILDQADYRIMIADVDEDQANILQKALETLAPAKINVEGATEGEIIEPQVFTRSFYSDVVIFTIIHKGPRENLVRLLASLQYPRLVMVAEHKNQLWLRRVR